MRDRSSRCGPGACPAYATTSTSAPLRARASAWYCMRGLRPRSPRTTVVTRMRSLPRGQERSIPEPRRPLALVFGPTAGHVYPALAIADAYRRAAHGVDVLFIGAASGPACSLLEGRGERVALVAGSALRGVGPAGKARAVPRVVVGMSQARRILRAHGTRLVLGLGGYASGGVLLAART